jgi:prepilin-type N-terminal cleavage/methylation domain-containing protein
MKARGFTLVEMLVAMVVLEVGLLGVVGTLVLAADNLRRAATLERAVTEVGRLYDSLAAVSVPGTGVRGAQGARVRWSLAADGGLRLEALAAGDSAILTVQGRALLRGVP